MSLMSIPESSELIGNARMSPKRCRHEEVVRTCKVLYSNEKYKTHTC